MLTLTVWCCLQTQDLEKQVEECIQQIQSDRIDERERGLEALIAMGPRALPVLETRLKAADGEYQTLLTHAIERIRLHERKRQVLPPLKTVTLEGKDRNLREVLDEIGKQSGLPFELDRVDPKARISIMLKNATPWEAMDEICRKDRSLSYLRSFSIDATDPARPTKEALAFESGKSFEDGPVFYLRHYKIGIEKGDLGDSVDLTVEWLPTLEPHGFCHYSLDQAKDNRGNCLLQRGSQYVMAWSSPSVGWVSWQIQEPAGKIAVLKGTVAVCYSLEQSLVTIDNPGASVGKTFIVGKGEIRLNKYTVNEKEVEVGLLAVSKTEGHLECTQLSEEERPHSFGPENVRLVDSRGTSIGCSSHGWSAKSRHFSFATPPQGVARIEIRVTTRCFCDSIPFEFRDVSLKK